MDRLSNVSENRLCTCLFCLSLLGHKLLTEPRIKLFKIIKKPVLFHISFLLEDDDHKAGKFHGETISFTCQLTKI